MVPQSYPYKKSANQGTVVNNSMDFQRYLVPEAAWSADNDASFGVLASGGPPWWLFFAMVLVPAAKVAVSGVTLAKRGIIFY